MITIKMLAAWFMLSSVIFLIIGQFKHDQMNADRGLNTLAVLVAQGTAASILAVLN